MERLFNEKFCLINILQFLNKIWIKLNRFQVTPIRVQPQTVEVDENPAEFENFQRAPLSRERSRGQQG
jgi:hypothetical protein